MSAEQTTENFLKAMREFNWPDPQPVEYRLYYNEDGSPLTYTMEQLPGNYILVSQEVYISWPLHVRVRDGELVWLPQEPVVDRICPDQPTGTPCHPNNVCLVVDTTQPNRLWSRPNVHC